MSEAIDELVETLGKLRTAFNDIEMEASDSRFSERAEFVALIDRLVPMLEMQPDNSDDLLQVGKLQTAATQAVAATNQYGGTPSNWPAHVAAKARALLLTTVRWDLLIAGQADEMVGHYKREAAKLKRLGTNHETKIGELEASQIQMSEQVDSAVAELTQATEQHTVSLAEKSETEFGEILAGAREKETKAKAALGEVEKQIAEVGKSSLTYGYVQAASEAQTRGETVRKWAAGAAVGTVAIAIGAFVLMLRATDVPLGLSVAVFTAVTASGALATYLGRDASGDLAEARELRRVVVELNSLGPFMATLDSDQQAQMRRDLVPTYFTGARPASEGKLNAPEAATKEIAKSTTKAIASKAEDIAEEVTDA